MSDVETAQTGAEVAPVVSETTQAPIPTTENGDDAPRVEQVRDEAGRFVPQARVNEITRARREAERRADSLERELASYRQPQREADTRTPVLSDYQNDANAWSQAVVQHATRAAQEAAEQQYRQRDEQQQRSSMERQFDERSRAYSAEHPDFDQTLETLTSSITFRPEIVEVIGLSEVGPAVVDYLGKHLDEADRISRLPPHLAALHLGRIEAQVSAPKPKPVTGAPNPPPTLGGGKATVTKNPDHMTVDEWNTWRQSQLTRK